MKKQLANEDVRTIIRSAGLRHFEVFQEMKVSEPTWTRLMRTALSADDKHEIIGIVNRLSKLNEGG